MWEKLLFLSSFLGTVLESVQNRVSEFFREHFMTTFVLRLSAVLPGCFHTVGPFFGFKWECGKFSEKRVSFFYYSIFLFIYSLFWTKRKRGLRCSYSKSLSLHLFSHLNHGRLINSCITPMMLWPWGNAQEPSISRQSKLYRNKNS